ncbi:hypothetical protein Glove_673g29 [Diversispora epigaea]|uniref:Protein YAE1 n=1 Tax=Diversispora epigaea TaxID=1348612 RepID=A0A397G6M0_9GLOM|nr:hypothetical protein Glove_673g29 [Diversispora epigaea]
MDDKFSDIWEMSDEEENSNYDNIISSKEWNRMNENFGNLGYKEGIIEGKDITIQKGFDKGYIDGARIGKEIGRLRGILNTLLEFHTLMNKSDKGDNDNKDNEDNEDDEDDDKDNKDDKDSISLISDKSMLEKIKSLENELANLSVEKIFTKEYFQQVINSSNNIDDIDNYFKSQEIITNDTGTECNVHKEELNIDSNEKDEKGEKGEKDKKNNNLETKTVILKNVNDFSCCGGDDSSCCMKNECSKFIPQTGIIEEPVEQLLKKHYKEINNLLTASGFDQI